MTIWKNAKKYKTEGSSLNLNNDTSGCRRTERAQENINHLQEKLIEDPRISARKNSLGISKSTFNRITKRELKWHPYKMHERKERNNLRLFSERKWGFTYKSSGKNAKDASLSSKKWRTYRRKRKLAVYIRNKNIYYVFVLNIEIIITTFY